MFTIYNTVNKTLNTHMTGIVTAPANIVAYIVHVAFKCISTVPHYKYIMEIVDKTCKNYRATPSHLGGGTHGMLWAITHTEIITYMLLVLH